MLGLTKRTANIERLSPTAPLGNKPLGEIYTMPTSAGSTPSSAPTPQAPSHRKLTWLWWVIGVIILGVGGVIIYFNFGTTTPSTNTNLPVVNNNTNQPVVDQPPPPPEEPLVEFTPLERDRLRYLDIKTLQAALELYYTDRGLYPISVSGVELGKNGAKTLSAAGFSDYPQNPIYLAEVPTDPQAEVTGASYSYTSPVGSSYNITFSLEQGVANLIVGFHYLTPKGFDGADDSNKEPDPDQPSLTPPVSSPDTDSDGLTDVEELLYGSLVDNQDSDNDGYLDGSEVIQGYDPIIGEGALLAASSYFFQYQNPQYNYSLLYPAEWQIQSLDELSREVIFTSATDEFIQVIVQDNPELKSGAEWYISYVPSLSLSEVPTVTIGEFVAARSLDGLNLYLAVGPQLITLSYNIGTHETADYLTTWQMMYQSFAIAE
ncbi:MAG: hypothetical protein ABIJ81_03405 [Patescibacteria group bacterium]